jgi:hypothetical protein
VIFFNELIILHKDIRARRRDYPVVGTHHPVYCGRNSFVSCSLLMEPKLVGEEMISMVC